MLVFFRVILGISEAVSSDCAWAKVFCIAFFSRLVCAATVFCVELCWEWYGRDGLLEAWVLAILFLGSHCCSG